MKKYETIVEGTWSELTVFAESVPHLLHWDLAYLWVLEKDSGLRPTSWRTRIEAWRYLVTMLLAGELSVVEEPIPRPLRDYTRDHGIERIYWVVAPRDNRKIGVLSPTVLARPLPDFQEKDLDIWDRQRRAGRLDNDKKSTAKHFVNLIVEQLRAEHPPGSFHDRLASVLASEFESVEEGSPSAARIHRTFPVLRNYSWGHQVDPSRPVAEIELPINRGTGSKVYFIPYCECGKSLLQKRAAEPLVPPGDVVELTCAHCGLSSEIELADLLLWNRTEHAQAVIWKQNQTLEAPPKGYPPEARITDGGDIEFEWEAALVAGDKDLRFLRLRFPNYTVRAKEVDEIFYSKLLVPGQLDGYTGLPVRWEWLDGIPNIDEVKPAVNLPISQIVYRDIEVKGWPAKIRKVYAGDLQIEVDPELSVGVFPKPDSVCGEWQWFRVFLEGLHRERYRLSFDGEKELLPTLAESLAGCPEKIAVVRRTSRDIGAIFLGKRRETKRGREGMVYLGIDFGTSNSLVYFVAENQVDREVEPAKNAVRPADLAAEVGWIAGEPANFGTTIGSFLPLGHDVEGRADPYIVPSALWQLDGWNLIRWGASEPVEESRALTGFKWDREGGADHMFERESFLSELFLVAVPSVLKRLGLSRLESVEVRVGMAFPLAFGMPGKQKMRTLLTRLEDQLRERTGLRVDFFSVNEAIACVDAFGAANKGETYLVADLGGATLDVALYTAQGPRRKPDLHQLGSIEFAGETFIEAFAATKEADEKRREMLAWQVRDAILAGECRERYGKQDAAQRVLGRFRSAAFEYLRTMIAAFHKRQKTKTVKLVLAGNGWHLTDAFDPNASADMWKTVYRRTYEGLVGRLGGENLELYMSPEMDALPSTKHFVVIGALRNATSSSQRKQLEIVDSSGEDAAENQVRLPSGRGVRFSRVGTTRRSKKLGWSILVGEGAKLEAFADHELKDAAIDFDFGDLPDADAGWVAYLLSSFGVARLEDLPYPAEQRLRALILAGITGDPSAYLDKGPLQLILENTWAQSLSRI